MGIVLVFLALMAAAAFFYRQYLFGDKVIPFDSKDQYLLYSRFVTHSLKQGHLALWAPYTFSGYPAFADPQYLLFSPATLLMTIPSQLGNHYFDAIEILHIFLGGFFMFLLARDFGLIWPAGLLAALVFMFGGPMSAKVQSVAPIYALAYFPLAFLLLKRTLDSANLTTALITALVTGPIILSGLHVAVLMLYTFGLFFLFRAATDPRPLDFVKRRLPLFALIFVVAFGLVAIQILPMLEFADYSNRSVATPAETRPFALWPATTATFLFPDFFGATEPFTSYWGKGDPTEAYLYAGAAPLFLAALGGAIALTRAGRSSSRLWFFVILGLLALIYSFGTYWPFYSFFFDFIPGVSLFRRPVDAMFIFNFALALLAGVGLHCLLQLTRVKATLFLAAIAIFWLLIVLLYMDIRYWHYGLELERSHLNTATHSVERFLVLLPIIVAAFALMIFPKPRQRHLAIVLLLGITFADLTYFGSTNGLNSASDFYFNVKTDSIRGDSAVIDFLRAGTQGEEGQIYRIEPVYAGTEWHNAPLVWRLQSTAGYSPLLYKRYMEYADALSCHCERRQFNGLMENYNSPLFDLLNVKYIVTQAQLREVDPKADPLMFPEVYSRDGYHVYENQGVLPRAFMVYQAQVIEDESRMKAALASAAFDPQRVVLLEKQPSGQQRDIQSGAETGPSSVNISHYSNNEIKLGVSTSRAGFLMLSELYFPGWKAYVDGKQTELLRADYVFRALQLPNGRHEVRLVFDPGSFRLGRGISLATLALVLAGIAWRAARAWRSAKSEPPV